MIPLSVVDSQIKNFKAIAKYDPLEDPITQYIINVVIPVLEGLKKEATLEPIEQKINDRIAELEQEKKEAEGKRGIFTNCLIEKIEELRKLLK